MAKYRATYFFNVRRVTHLDIEAEDNDAAMKAAREQARSVIEPESTRIENLDGFGGCDDWDAHFFLDDAEGEEVDAGELGELD